jgi:hypothetical protein
MIEALFNPNAALQQENGASQPITIALRHRKCCNALCMGMPSAKFLKRQAAACADMAAQTEDEASRERCLRLEQTYLQLAQAEEQIAVPANVFAEGERTEF